MSLQEAAFDTAIGTLAGLRSGSREGVPVLALHGWLDNAASFAPLSAHLHGLDLVMLDLPGHGRSAHLPAGTDYSLAASLNALLDVVDGLGWERFAVLGHSMGAGIGSVLAAALPARVQRLVAIEALGPLTDTADHTASRLRSGVAALRELRGKQLRVFPDLATPIRARMQANQLDESGARLLVERGVRAVQGGHSWSSDPRLTLPSLQRMTQAQADDLLAAITCPALVLFADPAQDYFPDAERRQRVARLPDARLHVLPGTHHLHLQQPAQVAAVIGDFLLGA